MYRTDKKFMRNPATASSRIYIGYLQESVLPGDLEHKFSAYGNILGLVLQRGFAFIQYENEDQAQAAINKENGLLFFGKNIVVRRAMEKKRKGGGSSPTPGPHGNVVGGGGAPPKQNSSFKEEQQQQQQQPQNEEQRQQPSPAVGGGNNNAPVPGPQPKNIRPVRTPEPANAPDSGPPEKRRKPFRPPQERHPHPPPVDKYREAPTPAPYYPPREEMYPPPQAVAPPFNGPPPPVERPDRNDCEIIVVSKPLTEYAEYIEQRLKALNLIVDLLFPNDDVPIGRVLANISSRGCLYAILVMPQNEEHRSLTLNVLHGIPQEHRNMPIEDALILISRNFDAYMRGEQTGAAIPGSDVNNLGDRHPESIQMLLNLLAENRQITTSQYDKLIKYLQDRRELQSQHEVAEGLESGNPEASNKQTELQNRIMNILNKSSDSPKPVAAPAPMSITGSNITSTPAAATAATTATNANNSQTPLLNDPSVQKALDSLLSGEMFKSISASI